MTMQVKVEHVYEDAHKTRIQEIADASIKAYWYYLDLDNGFKAEYIPIAVSTTAFNGPQDLESTQCWLIDNENNKDVDPTTISRIDADIWPFWPSNVFYPDPGDPSASLGVLYVAESFFTNRQISVNRYRIPIVGDKWPPTLGQGKRKAAAILFELLKFPHVIEALDTHHETRALLARARQLQDAASQVVKGR
jgi:hypothetical protein